MSRLQEFAYKAAPDQPPPAPTPAISGQEKLMEREGMHPATLLPRRVPLSDLICNTPAREEAAQNVSPDDKVVWKLSPKKVLGAAASSQENQHPRETSFINFIHHNSPHVSVESMLSFQLMGRCQA